LQHSDDNSLQFVDLINKPSGGS